MTDPHAPRVSASASARDESRLTTLVRRGARSMLVGRLLRIRARLPGARHRPLMLWNDRVYTYADVLMESERFARLFRRLRQEQVRNGKLSAGSPLVVGLYAANDPWYVFAVFGAALDGDLVVALNTGFRGEILANLIDRTAVRALLTDAERVPHVHAVLEGRSTLHRSSVLVKGDVSAASAELTSLDAALSVPSEGTPRRADASEPLLVIFTSGTTAAPKGVGCSHIKLLGASVVTSVRTRLRPSDRGYVSMPLFHSNAWFLGIMPLLLLGGSFVLKPRFSASAFEPDMLRYGVTYLNYVGQPLHYIVEALEKKHGSPEAVCAALAEHPCNHFRMAHGNGAPASVRQKLIRYLGMEHIYELYGSSEAVINTVVRPNDPIDSVGHAGRSLVILDEHSRECPPARVDARGHVLNYAEAVGEICARARYRNLLFDGYFNDEASTNKKYRDGFYRSGDLGHVRIIGGRRYLYFDGRTDDWIRKDGENFSAESVARFVSDDPTLSRVVAYGVPAPVSDEFVAVAIELREGATFDPQAFHDRLLVQQHEGGMDPKWMPDFVRVVDTMPTTTGIDKILVRQLKRQAYDLSQSDMVLYTRKRGDTTYRRFDRESFEVLRAELESHGRANLLK